MKLGLARWLRLATKVGVSAIVTVALLSAVTQVLLKMLTPGLSTLSDDPRAFPGYTLIAPRQSTNTYLIDLQGRVVKSWKSRYTAGQVAYLLEDGHLLRAGKLASEEQHFVGAGAGGRVQEFTWEGELVWDFKLHDEKRLPHHDITRLPGGNVLLIVWEIKTPGEAIAAGRGPESADGPWLVDSIIEVQPTGKSAGAVVWEWHAWDHLIQDRDPSRANYGDVAAHPELIDINFGQDYLPVPARSTEPGAKNHGNLDALRSIGYLGSPAANGNKGVIPEWTHVNAVAYDAELDQIMLTVLAYNEFWVIDHGTTTAEAAGHAGGRGGRGGDLLYRWGNPRAYRAGTAADQRLFAQHDAHWIPAGRPGAGHVLVFNNGGGRPGGDYSSVDEIVPPVNARGRYVLEPGAAYGPRGPVWSFTAPRPTDFFAWLMSGAQRLLNGNTLICDSVSGAIFEVTPKKEIVWKYLCVGTVKSGKGATGSPPRSQEILAPFLRDLLKMSPEQRKDMDEFQRKIGAALENILKVEQKKRLGEGSGGFALPGQILSRSRQAALMPTDEQERALAELQKAVNVKLGQLLTADQMAHVKKMKEDFLRGTLRAGAGRVGGPARIGPADSPDSGSSPGRNSVFRAYRYGADYAGLAGKDLKPGKTIDESESKDLEDD